MPKDRQRGEHMEITADDYELIKSNLELRLTGTVPERVYQNAPYREIEDMVLTYRIRLKETENSVISIIPTNNALKKWRISEQQLFHDAIEADTKNRPPLLKQIKSIIQDSMETEVADSPLWVATVEGGAYGACVIVYPGFLEHAAETLHGSFFVLPSSIHEVILLPERDVRGKVEELEAMVRNINRSDVQPEERLSDSVYYYDALRHLFGKRTR